METAWAKETDPWSVIGPVSARGCCAPSFHPTPTTWAQDLMAPGAGVAGEGVGGGDHNSLGSRHPSSPLSPHSGLHDRPLATSALPPARTINSHTLLTRPGAREPKEAGGRQ